MEVNIQWQSSEDASETLNYFADKYIITKYKIRPGELVEDNSIFIEKTITLVYQ